MAFKDKRRDRWMVRWRTADGRHLQRSFVDRGDALRFESQVELDRPKYDTLMDMTFKDLAGKFVEAHINVHIHEGARAEYRAAVDEHVLPQLGEIRLKDLHLRDLNQLQAKLCSLRSKRARGAGGALAPSTVNFLTSLVRHIVKWGIRNSYLSDDPLANFKKLKEPKRMPTFWTIEERDQFLALIRDPGVVLARDPKEHIQSIEIFTIALYTGMRRGEILGLKRDSVDLERRTIKVGRTYDVNMRKLYETTKSTRDREIPMHERVYEILRLKKNKSADSLIFDIGYPGWINGFKDLCKRAGIKPIRFHDMRHTFAAILVSNGVPLAVIQELLGHSKIETTMVYAHLVPGTAANCLSALNAPAMAAGKRPENVVQIAN